MLNCKNVYFLLIIYLFTYGVFLKEIILYIVLF